MLKFSALALMLTSSLSFAGTYTCDVPSTDPEEMCNEIFLLPSAIFEKAQDCLPGFNSSMVVNIDTTTSIVTYGDSRSDMSTYSFETCGEAVYFTEQK